MDKLDEAMSEFRGIRGPLSLIEQARRLLIKEKEELEGELADLPESFKYDVGFALENEIDDLDRVIMSIEEIKDTLEDYVLYPVDE